MNPYYNQSYGQYNPNQQYQNHAQQYPNYNGQTFQNTNHFDPTKKSLIVQEVSNGFLVTNTVPVAAGQPASAPLTQFATDKAQAIAFATTIINA